MSFINCFGNNATDPSQSDRSADAKSRNRLLAILTPRRQKVNKKSESKNEKNASTPEEVVFTDRTGNTIVLTTDERIPLTPRECFLLIQNWRAISRKMVDTGIRTFIKLFSNNADLLELFPTVKQEIQSNPESFDTEILEYHAQRVMSVLDQAIHLIGDADSFFNLLHLYADYHAKKQLFSPDFFWEIEPALVDSIKETLGDRYTENMANIYPKVFKLILSTLVQFCREASENNTANDH
ncbi:Cytoglobin-1 [Trichinella pseudospiralis]|uniref:Cytoglobin-1 n=2 Tax=Trichinella pseudospiralis TaxID=6337 RepID=A0A0V1E6G3_TRIPS|nr:Cytoglobin-1 [Trichinella pseudospiralis]KRY69205.1 Cytoglobin-1 [Trichinella pseudospiralis]KRY69206.1 Cytoglobin-1 [Trichinella pseudospiralis]KRY84998.1 Cytoglobin-1 [Trichinella pseudospiralis]KRZ28805.1 Cytoglobin-1 [Trichinella pseudospiralis]